MNESSWMNCNVANAPAGGAHAREYYLRQFDTFTAAPDNQAYR